MLRVMVWAPKIPPRPHPLVDMDSSLTFVSLVITRYHTHTHTHTLTHSHTHTRTHPPTHPHTQIHTHSHTPTHTPKHARTHPRTHTHTHTHTTKVGICDTYRYGSLFSNAVIDCHIMMQCFMIWLHRVSLWLSDAAHNIIYFSFVLVAMCVYVVSIPSNNNVCFSDLQALGDLLMHTCGYSEHQEHQLEYKEETA